MKFSSNKKRKLLIVEDNDLVRDLLVQHFAASSQVIAISNGVEAIQTVERLPKIDILFTDFDLRGELDGLDVARAVRLRDPKTPIVLITGSDVTLPRIQELLSFPNTKLITKPFQKATLDQVISAFFDENHNSSTINANELP